MRWATDRKAQEANTKHFNGEIKDMNAFVKTAMSTVKYIGTSDRSNGRYPPAKIVWSSYEGKLYAFVLCAVALAKKEVVVVSFYDINMDTFTTKAKRFGMKKVG